jgi:serine phosphatase RsbU (regulator of sigma subunit)
VKVAVSGLPLGTFDDVSYDEVEIALASGDTFVFYSDGLVDARARREEYGDERLLRGLERHAALPAAALGEALLREFDAFLDGEGPGDDVTLIVMKVL